MHVDAGGLDVSYERAGNGPPVALAHGFVGDARSTWGSQIEALVRNRTLTLAQQRRGFYAEFFDYVDDTRSRYHSACQGRSRRVAVHAC